MADSVCGVAWASVMSCEVPSSVITNMDLNKFVLWESFGMVKNAFLKHYKGKQVSWYQAIVS